MEDLVTIDLVYSRLEEWQQRREDIIPIRAADHTKLTAETSQGELGVGDVPPSNERDDVSMGDISVPRPSKAASAMTHRADVPRDVDGRSDSSGTKKTMIDSRRKP